MVENAEKYRHDPKFVDDTIDTIAHSVARMRRLMEQLSSDSKSPKNFRVSIRNVLEKAVRRNGPQKPTPILSFEDAELLVRAWASVPIRHVSMCARWAGSSGSSPQ